MMPYQPDYDAFEQGQEAAIRDEIIHDIWLCHQRIERKPEQPTAQPGRDGFDAHADSHTIDMNKRAQSRSPK